MRAYCIDGPKFGTLFDGSGMEVHFPFVDEQHSVEYRKWFDVFGLAEAFAQADGVERWWPAPPSIPIWVYRGAFDGPYGALVLRFDGVRR